jgi:zinc protease
MKFLLGLILTGSLSILPLQAQEAGQPSSKPEETKAVEALPSLDQILDKFVAALGGKEAAEKITAQFFKGTLEVTNFGAGGTMEIYAKAPNKYLTVAEVEGYGSVKSGFNGTKGWTDDPQTGISEMTPEMLISMKRDADMLRNYKLKELYSKLAVKEKGKVGDQEVLIIEATPAEGAPEKFYFSAINGLLLRQDAERSTPQGKASVEIYFDDYRDVSGVKMPFIIRQNMPMVNIEIKLTEAKTNGVFDDAIFEMPKQK